MHFNRDNDGNARSPIIRCRSVAFDMNKLNIKYHEKISTFIYCIICLYSY